MPATSTQLALKLTVSYKSFTECCPSEENMWYKKVKIVNTDLEKVWRMKTEVKCGV